VSTADVHLLTGAYAADALSDEERRAFERHLVDCPTCAQEAAELVGTASRLATVAAEPAPPGLRERVMREVATVRRESPGASRSAKAPRAWYAQPLGMAASFLLVVSLALAGVAVVADRQADRAERTAARIASVATHPDRVSLDQPISTGGVAYVVAAEGDAVFRAEGLAVLPEDRSYQLWVMDGSEARSVGVLGRGTSSPVEHFVEDIGSGDSLGLTVEPGSGSDRPTTDPVLLMTMS
jgi:hypothetical protein